MIAVQVPFNKTAFIDLYYTDNEKLFNLHASAKLGQRAYNEEKWSDWIWWNNNNWAANVTRVDSFDKRSFLKENEREFQIHKSLFKQKSTTCFLKLALLMIPVI